MFALLTWILVNAQMLAAMVGKEDEVSIQVGKRALNSPATTQFTAVGAEKQRVDNNVITISDTQLDGQYVLLVAGEAEGGLGR